MRRLAIPKLAVLSVWLVVGGQSSITHAQSQTSGLNAGQSGAGTSLQGWGVVGSPFTSAIQGQMAPAATPTPWGQYADTGFQYTAPPLPTAPPAVSSIWAAPAAVWFRNSSGRIQ